MSTESEVLRLATEAVEIAGDVLSIELDPNFGEESIPALEDAVRHARELGLDERGHHLSIQRFGCYLLQVAATTYPGQLLAWSERFQEPVFEWGRGDAHVSMLAWRKVRGLYDGDDGDSLVFHWQGVREAIEAAAPGDKLFT